MEKHESEGGERQEHIDSSAKNEAFAYFPYGVTGETIPTPTPIARTVMALFGLINHADRYLWVD